MPSSTDCGQSMQTLGTSAPSIVHVLIIQFVPLQGMTASLNVPVSVDMSVDMSVRRLIG